MARPIDCTGDAPTFGSVDGVPLTEVSGRRGSGALEITNKASYTSTIKITSTITSEIAIEITTKITN